MTFRLLSRKFSIHVNEAKRYISSTLKIHWANIDVFRELANFVTHAREMSEQVSVTYLVSGEVPASASTLYSTQDEIMDVDGPEDDSDLDQIFQEKQVLVGERDLAGEHWFQLVTSCLSDYVSQM